MGKGGGQSSRQSIEYLPEDIKLKQLLYNQLMGLWDTTGGLGRFGIERPDLYSLGGDEERYRQSIMGYANRPAYSPEEYRSNVLGAFDTQSGAAGKYLNEILSPALVNQLTAAGMGRSGAVGESLGNAATQMALPLAQQRAGFEQNYPALLGQLNQTNTGLMGMGMEAAGIPRNLQLQDFLRQQGLVTGTIPLASGGAQPISQRQTQSGGKSGGVMSSLLPLGLAFGLAPMTGGGSFLGLLGSKLGGMIGGGKGAGAAGMGAGALGDILATPWGTHYPS